MSTAAEKASIALGAISIERPVTGKPHQGKVLAAVQAHADDIPFFGAGAIAKLIDEGYTGYLIQTTNDDKCGPTPSVGETVLSNEREVDELARVLGLKGVFNLGYRNHDLDQVAPSELRCRLILLFRFLQVDAVFTFNPWGHGEENPDHTVTGQAVEAARWMAGMAKDYPEQVAAGLRPHTVQEQYYWVARPHQPYNRVVDISPYLETKVAAMSVNKSQGPAGCHGSRLRARLARQGRRLPALGDDDETADRAYIRLFGLGEYRRLGLEHGLEYAEAFYYVPPGGRFTGSVDAAEIERYIVEHGVAMGERR
jgi:LmbE family N-acetylglucosaminyl deacetylase